MPNTPALKFGVAGVGVMGRNHARVASEMREFDLTTVFDPDAVTAEGVAAAYGASPVTTAQAFVDAGLDAAVVATPNRFHAEVGVALLEKGVHVLVEKPIAATVADAQRMIDAARANDRVLMVGQVERFNPAVETVKRAVADDEIISIQITRVGPFPPRMGEVGVVIDLAVHDIDIIRHLTESEIVEVQPQLARTRAEREDTALLQFRLDNGVIAHITTNWVTPYKVRTLQVATQNKFIVADLMTRQVTEYFGQQPDGSYSTRGVMSWPAEPLKKELEAFAYSVSHDLRSPLRHIDGFLGLLKEQLAATLDAQSQHYMDTISKSVKRMGELIDDLLSFSRMGRQEMTRGPVDLGALVEDVIHEFEPETKGRVIHWHIGELPVVVGDYAMLRVVLANLVSNALKFTQTREQTAIEIGCLPDTSGHENETVVFVRDNGVGFDMRYANKLFGVFERLHSGKDFEGTGIGLANVHRVVSRNGGTTWAEGKVNGGATFFFSLPRENPSVARIAPSKATASQPCPLSEGLVAQVGSETE